MCVIVRIESINFTPAQRLERIGCVLAMVYKRAPGSSGGVAAVSDEAVSGVCEGACFPGVVGGGGGEDHGCAFGLEEFGGVLFVGGVC